MMLQCHHSPVLPPRTCSFCNSSLPDSLLDICLQHISNNLNILCIPCKRTKRLKLKDGVYLPAKICERILEITKINGNFINIFKDRKRTKLRKVILQDSSNSVNDRDLEILLQHELAELDISYSMNLTPTSLKHLSNHSRNLVSLAIGKSTKIFPVSTFGNFKLIKKYHEQGYIFLAPSLRRLTLKNLYSLHPDFYVLLLKDLTSLTHLNLSNCTDLHNFSHTNHLTNLTSLVLYNVSTIEDKIAAICELKNLRHLDISQSDIENGIYDNENQVLTTLVLSLPKLTSLDISGTNLAGPGVPESCGEPVLSDIPGLSSRMGTPLQYLGLYGTPHDACRRHDIPAKLIAGNANEEQLLVAGFAFLDHLELSQKVLKELSQLVRSKACGYLGHVLNIVLENMRRFLAEKEIQVFGSSLLFEIVKAAKAEVHTRITVKRKIFTALLDALSLHTNNPTIMKNMCMIACHFEIPDDILFDFGRLVKVLLQPIELKTYDKKKILQFLNTLACHVDIPEKIKMGELGVMNKMIWLIERKLKKFDCDEILEFAWTIMWNATDETPINSRRFVELNGMEYFLNCYEEFSNDDDLVSSMMGLIGNVSEVCELHQYLMVPKYLAIFSDLLESKCDGIEVSYNAAGVIAYIASSGAEHWAVEHPDREHILDRLDKTIDRWNLNSKRTMMYRSFKPVWYLVKVYHTPQCQKWGLWTLANLTKVDPERYCVMIEKEGGLALLQELMDHSLPPFAVTNLAAIVIENCRQYNVHK